MFIEACARELQRRVPL